ncbi:DUF58 domain-containing protein [Thermobifida halotolerans]|uniref:DUF58 domain-containing protein n=1 Tax=Thermobifida halotolerans TaxID=483545 RepID=A0A399G7H7_9ACTN|nr:DUF58 domain-containing protein [Thermobifida halotolerans]UOE18209.1 DUF58 domain-containing protein [Thermobifida halotolerans]
MAVTGRAVFLAFVGVAAAFVAAPAGAWVPWVVLGSLLVALLADLALAPSSRAVRLEHGGDTSARLGDSAEVWLVVTNTGRRTLRATVRDAWRPSAGAAPRSHSLVVPPGGRRLVRTALTPSRRGDQSCAHVTVRSHGPLRLAARQSSHSAPWTVRVLPPFRSRRHLPGKLSRLRELDGQHRAMIRGQGSEFDSLREYVPGDDVRSIDWRATARRETVVVRTWRPERDRRILLVLDTSRTSAGRVGDLPRLEHSMDAALLLTALAARAGDRVDFLAYDRRVRARVRAHGRGSTLQAIVSAMAPLEPELVEVDAAGMVAAVLGGQRRSRQLVVLLTDLNAAALEEGLLPRLAALTARHLVLVAAVADPRVTEMAAERGDTRAVYNAAAAQRTIVERRRVTAELRRRGVEVVEAVPEELAPALADAYITLKAQGRL